MTLDKREFIRTIYEADDGGNKDKPRLSPVFKEERERERAGCGDRTGKVQVSLDKWRSP
jgi:hypothetical protein